MQWNGLHSLRQPTAVFFLQMVFKNPVGKIENKSQYNFAAIMKFDEIVYIH
jgi:hypothetical protein